MTILPQNSECKEHRENCRVHVNYHLTYIEISIAVAELPGIIVPLIMFRLL